MSGPTHDPVEEFFARERATVHELPGGPDRWDQILVESRRPRRRGLLPFVSAAAAAIVIGAVAWGTTGGGPDQAPASSSAAPEQTVTVTSTVTATPTSPSPSATRSSAVTRSGPLPAPATFGVTSISGGGGGHLLALGAAECGGKPCVSVVGSDDAGSTWTARSTFTDRAASGTRATPAGANQLVGVRLADAETGYAYGSTTWRTTNGGRDWRPFAVGGRTVLSLEIGGNTVWMVTAASCTHGEAPADRGCTGLEVWSAPVAASSATKVESLDLPHPVEAAWLSMDGADAYLSVSYLDQSTQTPLRRVSGTPTQLPRPSGCADTGAVWAWATANVRGGLVAVCRSASDPQGAYAVATSRDRGATWRRATASPTLGTPGSAGVWVTGVDLDRLVAVTHGLPTSALRDEPSTLVSSGDGGARWTSVTTSLATDRWGWVGAGGGDLVYAVGGTGDSYAVSTDRGATFREQSFRK